MKNEKDINYQEILDVMINTVNSKQFTRYIITRPELKSWLEDQTKEYNPTNINEQVWIVKNSPPTICKQGNKPLFNSFTLGYREFCGAKTTCACSREHHSKKLTEWQAGVTTDTRQQMTSKSTETFRTNYGVDNPMLSAAVKDKLRNTNQEKYGVDYAVNANSVQEKIKNTNLERYGVATPMASKEIQDKSKQTTIDRHGGLMTHARTAAYEKYQGKNPFQDKGVKEKRRATMIDRYGTEHALQNKLILDTMMENNIHTYGVKNVSQIGMNLESLKLFKNIDEFIIFANNKTVNELSIELQCSSTLLYRYIAFHKIPGIVHPKSLMEHDMKAWLTANNIRFKQNDNTIIKPNQIDFVLLDYNVGIELHGLFHHSEIGCEKDKDYHLNKYLGCKSNGIQLIQIWQDEYWTKKNIVRSKILHLCDRHFDKIFARKCQISVIHDAVEERKFYDRNHIQGFPAYRQLSISARFNENIVACMSWSFDNGHWNLIRYATDIDYVIAGMFSRLLKHSINKFNFHGMELVSFSDNRISDGKLYENSGWTLKEEQAPGYCYTDYSKRENRRRFQTKELIKRFDLCEEYVRERGEWNIAQEMGYDRLWDCGKKKWVINANSIT